MILKQKEKDGISLRRVHFWLIVGAVIISGLMFYSTYHLSTSFRSLTETSEQQIELRKAARELMDTYSGVIGPASRKNKATVTEF